MEWEHRLIRQPFRHRTFIPLGAGKNDDRIDLALLGNATDDGPVGVLLRPADPRSTNWNQGPVTKGSYGANEINPYRRAALEWLIANEAEPWVQNSLQRIERLYRRAGPHIEAFRLRGLSPAERAKAASPTPRWGVLVAWGARRFSGNPAYPSPCFANSSSKVQES